MRRFGAHLVWFLLKIPWLAQAQLALRPATSPALLAAYSPTKFVVMYGKGQRKQWETIAGTEFHSNGFCYVSKTVATVALHPVTTGVRYSFSSTVVVPKVTGEFAVLRFFG